MKYLFPILFFLFLKNEITAQDVFLNKYVKVETTDGRVIYGKVLENQATFLTLQTSTFRAENILKTDLKNIEFGSKPRNFVQLDSTKFGVDETHYLIISSSEGLEPGEGSYQNVNFVFTRLDFGIAPHFSCSMGATIFPELIGFYVMPKWSFPQLNGRGSTSLSLLGFKYLAMYGESFEESSTLIGYIDHTVKWSKNQITFGLGYGKAAGYWLETPVPTLSGLFKLSSKWYGVSETWMFYVEPNYPIVVSGMAIRRVGRKIEWDFGAAAAYSKVDKEQSPAIPYIGINIKFGKKK
jgi:hypothetical protein